MNPLWNYLVVAGYREGTPFLGHVDLLGTCYKDDFIATGYSLPLPKLSLSVPCFLVWVAQTFAEIAGNALHPYI
jgi:hypothetical protein